MARWLRDKDEGKMIFQVPCQYSLFLHLALCSSADLLINAAHGWHTAAGAAPLARDASLSTPIPPSNCLLGCYIPVSEKSYMEALLSEPFPRTYSPACLALCYDPGSPLFSHFPFRKWFLPSHYNPVLLMICLDQFTTTGFRS